MRFNYRISGGQKCGQWGPEIKTGVHNMISGGLKHGLWESEIKNESIIGFLAARNVVDGHLTWKLGSIKRFLVAINLLNGNQRSKLGSII